MMKKRSSAIVAVVVIGLAAFAWAQDSDRRAGGYWSAHELDDAMRSEVIPKAKSTEIGIAAKPIISTPVYSVVLASRYKTFPELHEYDTDIFVVQEGSGTLQIGGEIVDRKPMGTGQATGSSIKGGKMFPAAAGDVLYVPKNTPHMWHLNDGQRVSYIAFKVTEK
jgi:mannose-6-phosphate isomerase-like protein (cupin superfamily)